MSVQFSGPRLCMGSGVIMSLVSALCADPHTHSHGQGPEFIDE